MGKHRKIFKRNNAKLTITNHGKFFVFDSNISDDKGKIFQTLSEAKQCFCDTVDSSISCACFRMSSVAAGGFYNNCGSCWLGL
jgi:hypothetical protein